MVWGCFASDCGFGRDLLCVKDFSDVWCILFEIMWEFLMLVVDCLWA